MGKYAFFRGEIEKNLIDIWKSGKKCVALNIMKRRLISDSVESHTGVFKQHSVAVVIILFLLPPITITFSISVEFLLYYYFLCNLNLVIDFNLYISKIMKRGETGNHF